jgi:hypothetical protein
MGSLSDEEIEQLKQVLWASELLFPQEIADDLNAVVSSSHLRNYFVARQEKVESRGKAAGNDFLEKIFAEEDVTNERMPDLLRRMVSASKVVELGS